MTVVDCPHDDDANLDAHTKTVDSSDASTLLHMDECSDLVLSLYDLVIMTSVGRPMAMFKCCLLCICSVGAPPVVLTSMLRYFDG